MPIGNEGFHMSPSVCMRLCLSLLMGRELEMPSCSEGCFPQWGFVFVNSPRRRVESVMECHRLILFWWGTVHHVNQTLDLWKRFLVTLWDKNHLVTQGLADRIFKDEITFMRHIFGEISGKLMSVKL